MKCVTTSKHRAGQGGTSKAIQTQKVIDVCLLNSVLSNRQGQNGLMQSLAPLLLPPHHDVRVPKSR